LGSAVFVKSRRARYSESFLAAMPISHHAQLARRRLADVDLALARRGLVSRVVVRLGAGLDVLPPTLRRRASMRSTTLPPLGRSSSAWAMIRRPLSLSVICALRPLA